MALPYPLRSQGEPGQGELPLRPNLARSPGVTSAALLGDKQQQTLQRPAVEIGSLSSVLQNAERNVS